MERKPEDFMSRDKDGFMHKITDLMDDDDVLVAPGKVVRLKVPVKYVGGNPEKHDNIAGTGLTWKNGETLPVDAEAAEKLLRYPDVWAYNPDAIDTYTIAADGSAVIEYRASADEVAAIIDGRAELRVVAIDSDSDKSSESVDLLRVEDMTKNQLIAFANEKFNVKLDGRKNVDDLRALVVALVDENSRDTAGNQEIEN